MNGFTSSLHVKGATAKRVQQAVTDLLQAEGFQVLPADDDSTDDGQPQITRGVWVAKTRGDWVSVFCSDFMFQQEIGRELSKQLKTHALNVWVTEGSSWHYSLFNNGEEVDQFDSTGGDDDLQDFLDQGLEEISSDGTEDDDDDADDIAEISDEDDEASPIQEGLTRIAELQEQIAGQMPADVKEIYERLNEGKASLGDMRRFDQWSQANQAELARFQDQLQQHTAELTATMQGVFSQGLPGDTDDADPASMLQGVLPPDIAEVFSKLLTGQASPEEIQRFANDIGGEVGADELDADLDDMTNEDDDEIPEMSFSDEDGDEGDFEDDEAESGLTEEQLQVHLGALQPLLEKDVDQDELAETLTAQDEAPEEPLSDFLSMLGIGGTLATMDFDLIEQTSEEDLEDAGIELGPLLLVRSS